ncbi:MAG: hypothetical protein V1714_02545 [Pseudomonadota bacterium]
MDLIVQYRQNRKDSDYHLVLNMSRFSLPRAVELVVKLVNHIG